jgi:hypothetical protein
MRVVIYHEVRPETLGQVLKEGIKRNSQGQKSDSVVQRTDECLEGRIPEKLSARGVSRGQVVYGFMSHGTDLIDIHNGKAVPVTHFSAERDLVLLRITVDSTKCFVSDLDAYDAVKMSVKTGADDTMLSRLCERYWERILPLEEYQDGRYRRPEIMVVSDIDPDDIDIVTAGD